MERFLISQYKEDINKILQEVNSKNLSLAVQIASIPEMIRGYGHVKEEHMKKASIKRDQLLDSWNSKDYESITSVAAE
jgi:indolepyruvate ferredoxin oxidoreductase